MEKQRNIFFALVWLTLFSCFLSTELKAQLNRTNAGEGQNDFFSPDAYNISWKTPSSNAKGSMPIGNGDIGANVWVEPDGELKLLISKSDAFDEFNRLLKLGLLHIRTRPSIITADGSFRQTLQLKNGCIKIETSLAELVIWIDANHPVVQIDLHSTKKIKVEAWIEDWRKEVRMLGTKEGQSAYGTQNEDKRVNPDSFLHSGHNFIAICHRNIESIWEKNLKLTGLNSEIHRSRDPLLNRTFGLLIWGKGFQSLNDTMLNIAGQKNVSLKVLAYTQVLPTCLQWLKSVTREKDRLSIYTDAQRFSSHKKWWEQYWNRSWIEVTGRFGFDTTACRVSQVYTLQRYINACAGRGAMPIKFNGSLFTVPDGFDADYRAWGGCYWWQNTRLPYWSMLYSGDYDLMKPLFNMYVAAVPLRKAATQKYYGHGGAFFPETMNFWGNYTDVNYGVDRNDLEEGMVQNDYIKRYWQSGIELATLMLNYYDATQSKKFAIDTLLPLAREVIAFYSEHWNRNDSGIIVFSPAQSLETWHNVIDPTPDIAGLSYLLSRLMHLDIASAEKNNWEHVLNSLPSIPLVHQNNETYLLPARLFDKKSNSENCELYAVFPYPLYTVLSPANDLEVGLATWKRRIHKEDIGWQQNCIQAALLGLANETKEMIVKRVYRQADGYRFPGFFGPNYDWTPDQDHPSVMLIALQRMIMQCEDAKIVLAPSWPANWNVRFKLSAPLSTTVNGKIENGKVVYWNVFPSSRRKDVTIGILQETQFSSKGNSSELK